MMMFHPERENAIRDQRPLYEGEPNNRGAAIFSRVGVDAANRVRTVVESPRNAGDNAEAILVTLGSLDVPDGQLTTPVEMVAVLDWGVGGASFSAEVDWSQGSVFSLPASFARVSARLERSTGTPVLIEVAASLAYGPARGGFTAPARRTIAVDDLAPTVTSDAFAIPAWARSFVVLGNTTSAPNLRAHVSDADPATWTVLSDFTSRANTASQHAGAVDIPNGARVMKLQNLSASETASSLRVVFTLAF